MTRRNLSVEEFLALLPEQPEFEELRLAVLRASAPDPERIWSNVLPYSTLDRRSVSAAQIPQILAEAEATNRQRARRLSDSVNIALSGLVEGPADARIEVLVAAGEEDEKAERWRDAVAHYTLAARLGELSANLELRALAQRRLGRAWLHCGEFRNATAEYGASLVTASTCGSVKAEITAATGLGNVSSFQGRWHNAAIWYEQALQRCGESFERERGQLCVNLSMTSRERRHLDDARQWLDRAAAEWASLTSTDHSGWFNNDGLLHLACAEHDAAEQSFLQALELALSHVDRAMILDNLANVALRQERVELAEARARDAEEHAIRLGSPRILAEVYLRLGVICRLRADANGVVFFEKALGLCRSRGYSLLFGSILREYALFRKSMSDPTSASALFTDALNVFSTLGAEEHVAATRSRM